MECQIDLCHFEAVYKVEFGLLVCSDHVDLFEYPMSIRKPMLEASCQ